MDELLSKVEAFERMTVEYLTYSKIGKVLRYIAITDPPPAGDDQYNFRQRSKVLIDKWVLVISDSNAPQAST
ncbi:hypothetical protein FRB99_000611 [Tulasnella sp. 403]|nr:hypothetical protein FRB99_000611 [Tulasnella sp. 403]